MNTVEEGLLIYLRDRGITQAHIAREAGIDKDKLNRTLHGKRGLSMKEFEKISAALHTDPETLLKAIRCNDAKVGWLHGRKRENP